MICDLTHKDISTLGIFCNSLSFSRMVVGVGCLSASYENKYYFKKENNPTHTCESKDERISFSSCV
jgi:hypothetical protein